MNEDYPLFPLGRTTLSALLIFCLALAPGCYTIRLTEPDRTATEQLLLSHAVDRAVDGIDLFLLRGRKVFFDDRYFRSYDKEYAIAAIRELISKSGGHLVAEREASDIVVEARSGGLGIDSRHRLVGLPALALPIPLAGQVGMPEVALFKENRADATAQFALLAYETRSGAYVHSTGAMIGNAHLHNYKFIGLLQWARTNIPAKTRTP